METDIYTKRLSQNLQTIRQRKGLSTIALARILGVSQAKISYIENCKGILSARDIALLSRRLNIPVTEFFEGLETPVNATEEAKIIGWLVRYGATLLSKPAGIFLEDIPFEEIFIRALPFVEDERLHGGVCAALINQAASQQINVDRIFAIIGDNSFLIAKAAEEARLCTEIVEQLDSKAIKSRERAKLQLKKIIELAEKLPQAAVTTHRDKEEISELAKFVAECIDAKR